MSPEYHPPAPVCWGNSLPLQIDLAAYSSATAYIVIVIVALAEELLASVWLVVSSLSGTSISAREVFVSFKPSRTNPTRRIARVITMISLFTSTPVDLIITSANIKSKTYRIPGTPYQSGLLQIRYYTPRLPPKSCGSYLPIIK